MTTTWVLAPYLHVSDAGKAIDFYIRGLGATERSRYPMPDGKIGHAELDIHGNLLCLADSGYRAQNADAKSQRPIMLYLRVPDVDTIFNQAVAAGAEVIRPLADQPYGERNGGFIDPFGHYWFIGTER